MSHEEFALKLSQLLTPSGLVPRKIVLVISNSEDVAVATGNTE